MTKIDTFSRLYENLDQELKNACLKYEHGQDRKGLKVTKISLVYTPDADPYFDIQVEEIEKVRGQPLKSTPPTGRVRKRCEHPSTFCNGLSQLECIVCDLTVGPCTDAQCPRCSEAVDPPPPTLRSARHPVVEIEDEDEG